MLKPSEKNRSWIPAMELVVGGGGGGGGGRLALTMLEYFSDG
jgi:hypothetical protein